VEGVTQDERATIPVLGVGDVGLVAGERQIWISSPSDEGLVRDRRLGHSAHRSAGSHLPGVRWPWCSVARSTSLFVYGLIVGQESAANFVPVNTADDFLHLILGIGMIGLGLALTRDRRG
jgi:hypothetical protein